MAEVIQFDIETLTMGELGQAEYASGLTAKALLASGTHRMLLGVFVTRLRSSGQVPSWSELSNLRIVDAGSSPLLSVQDSPSPKSSDSD